MSAVTVTPLCSIGGSTISTVGSCAVGCFCPRVAHRQDLTDAGQASRYWLEPGVRDHWLEQVQEQLVGRAAVLEDALTPQAWKELTGTEPQDMAVTIKLADGTTLAGQSFHTILDDHYQATTGQNPYVRFRAPLEGSVGPLAEVELIGEGDWPDQDEAILSVEINGHPLSAGDVEYLRRQAGEASIDDCLYSIARIHADGTYADAHQWAIAALEHDPSRATVAVVPACQLGGTLPGPCPVSCTCCKVALVEWSYGSHYQIDPGTTVVEAVDSVWTEDAWGVPAEVCPPELHSLPATQADRLWKALTGLEPDRLSYDVTLTYADAAQSTHHIESDPTGTQLHELIRTKMGFSGDDLQPGGPGVLATVGEDPFDGSPLVQVQVTHVNGRKLTAVDIDHIKANAFSRDFAQGRGRFSTPTFEAAAHRTARMHANASHQAVSDFQPTQPSFQERIAALTAKHPTTTTITAAPAPQRGISI